jgi:hypothetical protein
VDKRKRQAERRLAIIDGARELVHEGQELDRSEILLDPRYLAIRPYMGDEAEAKLRTQAFVVQEDPYGTWGNYYLGVIRDEANRLAKEWEL